MPKKTSEYISDFLNFSRTVRSDFKRSYDEVNEAEKATQDILHQVEIGNAAERSKYTTQLSKIRKVRRQHKDFVDVHRDLNEFFTSDPTWISCQKKLNELLGRVRKQETYVENQRAYRPRALKNLTIQLMEDDK